MLNQMKIYDCFLYNGEEKMLNFRLHELSEYVDKHIIVESIYTYSGIEKKLKFNIQNFPEFKDKIIYKPCYIKPVTGFAIHENGANQNFFINEKNQRNYLKEGFRGLEIKTNDVIMLSDVDEIPDLTFLSKIKTTNFYGIKTSLHNFYYYNISCRKKVKWPGTVFVSAEIFQNKINFDFELIRNARHSFPLIGKNGDYTSGGWHFSYFGNIDYIIDKIKSFSHSEYSGEKYTNPEKIKELIESKKDLFFREDEGEQFESVVETYLPKYIHLLDEQANMQSCNHSNDKPFPATIRHQLITKTEHNGLLLHEIAKLDKKTIFHDSKDDGYNNFSSFWWSNPDCPYSYKYLHLDSLYPPFYFQPGGSHPTDQTSKELYDYMQQIFELVFGRRFNSILELGSGGGEITLQFKNHLLDFVSVEGTSAGVERLIGMGLDKQNLIQSDLRLFRGLSKKFDLVMCTEVAEHLEPTFSSKIVELCTSHADAVWFSAAEPSTACPHYHHPNEMYSQAWDNLFAFFGFNKFVELNNMHGRAKRLYLNSTLQLNGFETK